MTEKLVFKYQKSVFGSKTWSIMVQMTVVQGSKSEIVLDYGIVPNDLKKWSIIITPIPDPGSSFGSHLNLTLYFLDSV